jgi:hypothetical protein
MQLVNELENDLAFAVLVDRKDGRRIESKDVLPLINRIREALEPISEKDHAYSEDSERAAAAVFER